ncbi:MAG: TIGR02281 family clan AA aspartic protease [Rhodobacteraceae bacterium]|nr:TIGR02281 family clan AA aspartic protease [Paracoccaceae bacterium]
MSGDDLAYLSYAGLFLLVFGSGFLYSRRGKMGQTLQMAAIWALIFVGIIIVYGFKDTLQGQLFPGQAQLTESGGYSLARSADGHFYLTLDVNEQAIEFMVDTGASGIVLTQEHARVIGLDPDHLSYLGQASTANGMVATAPVTLDSIRLGDIEDTRVRASVNGGEMEESLLGMDYLSRFGEIRIKGDTMTLVR